MNDLAQYLPPEALLDEDHPANDQYIKNMEQLQKMVVGHSATMSPRYVQAVKLHHTGQTQVSIAETLDISPQTVGKAVNSYAGKRLRALLAHYHAAVEGPNEAQRRNMLWRIAMKHEDDEPKTSINAVAELNRMTIADYTRAQTPSNGQAITVIINQQQLPKGELDK